MSIDLLKTGRNALSILTSDVMNRVTSFVLYALVARHLGAQQFGQLALALTLFYTAQVFAVAGVKTLIVRQVATDRARTNRYFIHACWIVLAFSLASCVGLFGFVRLMHYERSTSQIVLLLSLGLFPYALSAVCEGVFQAWERMQYIPYVNVPVNILKICSALLLLSGGGGLYPVVFILLGSLLVIAVAEVWVVTSRFPRERVNLDLHFARSMVRSASTFLGIDGVIAVMSGLNVVLLSKLASETQVGLYSAATQLLVPLLLVYQSIAQSVFPVMCRRVEPTFQVLKGIAEKAMELLLVLALPAVAGLYFFGEWALALLYKNPAFLQAFPVLRIIAWTVILQVFTSVLGQVLVASHREKVTLRIVAVDTLVNLLVGWPLISRFGLRGAGFALLITKFVDFLQHYVPVSRLFSGIPVGKIIWKPAAAAVCMGAYLAVSADRAGLLTGISATLIYSGALFALTLWVCGGLRQFRDKYLVLLNE